MNKQNPLALLGLIAAIVVSIEIGNASSANAALEMTQSTKVISPQRPSPNVLTTLNPDLTPTSLNPATHKVWFPLIMASPPGRIYWGALVNGFTPIPANLQPGGAFDVFETRANKKMSIIHWGQAWKMNGVYQNFYAPWFDNVRNHGSIPLIDWGSWNLNDGSTQPDFQLADIFDGIHDAYIQQWANAAKTWGHPFFLRFDWEMNGNWQFPWSEQLNGNQPGDYVRAWRHVHDIFTQANATNVTWVWCPNISGNTTLPMASLYPGDSYADWTCLDGYNKENTWLNFNQVFNGVGVNWVKPSYNEILAVAPSKPIMIAETASLEASDGGTMKAAWVMDAFVTQVPTFFPNIKAVVWFNWDDGVPGYTFPIESSSASINAFATAIGSSRYAANTFGNLTQSPIPPP